MIVPLKIHRTHHIEQVSLSGIRVRALKYINSMCLNLIKPHLCLPYHIRHLTIRKIKLSKLVRKITLQDLPHKELNLKTSYYFILFKLFSQYLTSVDVSEWENRNRRNLLHSFVIKLKELKVYRPTLNFGNSGPKEFDFYKIRKLESLLIGFDYPAPSKFEVKQLMKSVEKVRKLKKIFYKGNMILGKDLLTALSGDPKNNAKRYYLNIFNSYAEDSDQLSVVFDSVAKLTSAYTCRISLIDPEHTIFYVNPIKDMMNLRSLFLSLNIQKKEELKILPELKNLTELKIFILERSIFTYEKSFETLFWKNLEFPSKLEQLKILLRQNFRSSGEDRPDLGNFPHCLAALERLKSFSFQMTFDPFPFYNQIFDPLMGQFFNALPKSLTNLDFLSTLHAGKDPINGLTLDIPDVIANLQRLVNLDKLSLTSKFKFPANSDLNSKLKVASFDIHVTSTESLDGYQHLIKSLDPATLQELRLCFAPQVLFSSKDFNRMNDAISNLHKLKVFQIRDCYIEEWNIHMRESLAECLKSLILLVDVRIWIACKDDFKDDNALVPLLKSVMIVKNKMKSFSFYLFGKTYFKTYSLTLYHYDAYKLHYLCPLSS